MSKTSKTLTIILAVLLVIIVGVCVAVHFAMNDEEVQSQENGLSLFARVAMAGEYPTVEITATVTGSATDDLVWSLAWEDPNNKSSVSDYVSLSSLDKKATLVCVAKFDGKMILTCKTADGYATAMCKVRYAGKPTAIDLLPITEPNKIQYANREYDDFFVNDTFNDDPDDPVETLGKFYDFGMQDTVYFDLKYSNVFGNILANDYINKNVEIIVQGAGVCKVQAYDVERGEFYTNLDPITSHVGLDEVKQDMITCSIENGRLKVVRNNMSNYAFDGYVVGTNDEVEYRYVDGNRFFYAITIKAEGLNGVIQTETIYVRPILPTSLALDANEIVL